MKFDLSQPLLNLDNETMNINAKLITLPEKTEVTDVHGDTHTVTRAIAEEQTMTYRDAIVDILSGAETKKINTPEGTRLLLKLVGDHVDLSLAEIKIILDISMERALPVVNARLHELLNKEGD